MQDKEIDEFYKDEPVHGKIRSKICNSGKPVDWNELKETHDVTLEAYKGGVDKLEKTDK